MKGLGIFLLLVVIVGGIIILSNKSEPAPAPADETSDAMPNATDETDMSMNGTKEFDTAASTATWTGSKALIKDYYDVGTIKVKSGNAVFANGILTGGTVVFDMTSIATTSTGRGNDADATSGQAKHMMSADFFDAAAYPESKFVITSAAREAGNTYLLTGDLTIKGQTHPVSFPVDVVTANGVAIISGTATIDRTVWGVTYGSGKFFQDLGDKVIGDTFTLEFKVVTK